MHNRIFLRFLLFIWLITALGIHAQTTLIYNFSASGGYAPNSNLAYYVDSVTGSWSLQYDSLNRLQSSSSVSGYYRGLGLYWIYDFFGNRLSQTPSGNYSVAVPNTISATYSSDNRIATSSIPGVGASSYDASGNMTFDGLNNVAYDAENRICAVLNSNGTLVQYLYDAEGRRVAKGHSGSGSTLACPAYGDFVVDEKYVLGQAGEQVTQLNGSDQWQHSNIYANEQLLATYDQEGNQQNLHFNVTDHLGTKRVQVSSGGAPELYFVNLPFGDGLTTSGTTPDATQHHFTGKERDTESGLDYMTARYYASATGRFTSPDPLMFNELRLINPQRWNMYSYGVNNPLLFTDPDGRDAIAVNFGADVHGLGHMGIISVHADGNATYSRFGPQHPGSAADVGQVRTTTDLPKVQFDSNGNPTEASYKALTESVAKFEDNYTGPVKMFHYKTSEAETAALDSYIKAAQAASDAHRLNYVGPFSTCVTYCMIGLHRAGVDRAALFGLHPLTMVPNYFAYLLSTNADSQHHERVTVRIVPDSVKPIDDK